MIFQYQIYVSCKLSDTKNVTKPWSYLWLGSRQEISEEGLQQVPPIKLLFKTKFQEVKKIINQKLLDW